MYDIGIPEIKINSRLEDTDHISIRYEAEASERPHYCTNPRCGHQIIPHVHSSKNNLIRDIKAEGKLVFINLKVRRYRCPDCNYVFPDKFSFYEKNAHITNRLKQEFVDRCIKGETFNYIARDYGVDHKTVAAAFKAYSEVHAELLTYDYTPVILGIDEAHIDDHYRLVLTDILGQRLLDIKKNNHKPTVNAYLRTLDKSVCKAVTMDFAPGYASCVERCLPDAYVIIDKFHAVQEVNRCLDNVRKDLQNGYRQQGIDIRRFKRSRTLFMVNWEDLTVPATDKLNEWFEEFPDLFEAYMVKETFRDIYLTAHDKIQATRMLNAWIGTIPDWERFHAMRNTFTTRKEHVLNYWNYHWTNAYTESINNRIKAIEKAGRGYKFDTLRERCLLEINTPRPERFNPREATYIDTQTQEVIQPMNTQKAKQLYVSSNVQVDYQVSLNDCLTVYLECHSKNHEESFANRMKLYYEKLSQLHRG